MTRLWIHPPDGAPAEQLSLGVGEAVLVGRDPDLDAVTVVAGVRAPTRTVVVASPLVSSNHVVVWRDEHRIHARDLESKNGTFLRLEGGVDASVDGARDRKSVV